MIEIVLLAVIIALVILLGWKEYLAKAERTKFINALIAKDAGEAALFDTAENPPKSAPPKVTPDLVPESELSQSELENLIEKGVV